MSVTENGALCMAVSTDFFNSNTIRTQQLRIKARVRKRKKGDDTAKDITEAIFVMDAGDGSLPADFFRGLQKEERNHHADACNERTAICTRSYQ